MISYLQCDKYNKETILNKNSTKDSKKCQEKNKNEN